MRETWYVLEDGSVVDPNDCAPDDEGVLTHSSGVPVAMKGQVPHSRGVDDADAERAKAKAAAEAAAEAAAKAGGQTDPGQAQTKDSKPDTDSHSTRDMNAEKPKRAYKTRESKAD